MLSRIDTASPSDRVSRREWLRVGALSAVGLSLPVLISQPAFAAEKPTPLIGYTEGRNDLEGGQFANWVTQRACVVGADGHEDLVAARQGVARHARRVRSHVDSDLCRGHAHALHRQ